MNRPTVTTCRKTLVSRRWRYALIVSAGLVLSIFSASTAAQDVSATSDEQTPKASDSATTGPAGTQPIIPSSVPPQVRGMSGHIQYVGPDTYILLDAEGRPQLVPGMTYEDFLAAWKKSQQAPKPDTTPRYTIESIKIDGSTRDGYAELDFVATVHLLTDGQIEVPLGLVGAILQGQPRFGPVEDGATPQEGDAQKQNGATTGQRRPEDFLTHNPEQGGFVARVTGQTGERRVVSLHLIVPLARDGTETTLPLSCPRALSSNITMTTDTAVANASANSGTLLAQEPTEKGGTRLEVAGAVGTFRLTWQTGDNGGREFATVLSAAGAIRVAIDGRSVRSDAQLHVQSYGGGFDRFRVRLPPGAQLIRERSEETSTQGPNYRITIEQDPPQRAARGPADSQIVLVEFPEKQQGPVTVDLSTEQPIGLEDGVSSVELAGFEVLGAVRQFGDVAVDVADDWQTRWKIGPNVRQVDVNELEATLQHANLTAAFQYDRQPWSLGARIGTRQSRIHVTPQYELQCLPDEARLTVRLNYQVFGARAFEFRVRMEGWEMMGSPLESGGLVNQDRIRLEEDDTLVLPLAQASSPRAEITFTVRRPLPPDQSRLQLPLPVPVADSIGTGELSVRAADNVEIRPDLQNSSGLTQVAMTETRDERNSNGAALHFRSLLPEAVFAADRVSRTREVSADVAARIEVTQSAARVEQQVDYMVRYEPLKELVFEAPSELLVDEAPILIVMLSPAPDGQIDVDAGETPLRIALTPEEVELPDGKATTRLRVPLPQPRLGQFAVRIGYQVRRPDAAASSGAWQLPLVRPADGRATAVRAVVHAPRSLAIALNARVENSSWKPAESSSETANVNSAHEYVADDVENYLPLIVSAADFNPPSATIVERIWLQTWFSGDARQDRAAIRFRTAGLQAVIELPPQTASEEVEVLVDGQPADVLSRDEGRIIVRLGPMTSSNGDAADPKNLAHVLELRSRQRIQQALLTRHRLTPPQLVGATALSEAFWQIILPGDKHVVRSPARMTSASQWQWLGSFWGRRPVMSQPELEEWAGATAQLAPAAENNEYLYTGLAPVLSIELVTAPRWLIVLLASSAVLAVGLVWVYVRGAQQGWILVVFACLLAALAVAFPIPALLLAQASALGVIVAFVSVLLARIVSRPARWPVSLSGGSSQRRITPRADSILMPPVAAAASTAPTVPLRIPDSER